MSDLSITPTLYYEDHRVSVSDLYDYDLERLVQLRHVPFLPLLYKAMDLLDILANLYGSQAEQHCGSTIAARSRVGGTTDRPRPRLLRHMQYRSERSS